MKRKQGSKNPPRPVSRYKYYADNFGGAKKESSEPQVEEKQPKKHSRPPSVRQEDKASTLTSRRPPSQNLQT